ncbi:MAG: F0F1 ATP synthase subunit B [Solirubrobacterales bacterium]|nr:F0F1 ATP synthase subunit B [Solirubrobacterales bacterium]
MILTPNNLVIAAAESSSDQGTFLVTPGLGLMIWTLIAFGVTMWVLGKFALPRIREALDKRQLAIDESIDAAERTRIEADGILAEYRQRLTEARVQAEEITARARKSAEAAETAGSELGRVKREEMLEQTRRDIDAETRRAIQEIRKEVADLTVLATEKVTRKTLSAEDQQRLVEEALSELDFTQLSGTERNN